MNEYINVGLNGILIQAFI